MPDLPSALAGIASRIDDDMSERDVENAFLNEEFFTSLDYEGAGRDVRSELALPDQRRPDYITLDEHDQVTAIYEFKTVGRDLAPHEDQLFHYMTVLKSRYGVLTNGEQLELYKRTDGEIEHYRSVTIAEASDTDARVLADALRKPEWDPTDPESVRDLVSAIEPVSLGDDLGQEHFFDTFRLEDGSTFGDLVAASMDLLQELRDEVGSRFVSGAYTFWDRSFSRTPDDVPSSWDPFVDGEQDLKDFMYSLESAHALLGRLLLAKACDDHEFLPDRLGIARHFEELEGFGDRIDLENYPVAVHELLEDMQEHLVESLFEDDIFVWWLEGYGDLVGPAAESVAREVNPAVRESFSRAIARTIFALLKFDFSEIAGDPLGDLYQRYFDPETRKALGEFYTPQPVVEFILDRVGYEDGIYDKRLIDPACGSGTFLVEAVQRYVADVHRYESDPDWKEHLKRLCVHPQIVGLDIHPFAVLMAQIRFMVAVLPEYKQAKLQDPNFTIRRLPIFRTDSLYDERKMGGAAEGDDDGDGPAQVSLSVYEESGDIHIPIPLPLKVDDGDGDEEFLTKDIRMPLYTKLRNETDLRNFGEYFAAMQGVLDVVKMHMNAGNWSYRGGLTRQIKRYTGRDLEGAEAFFEPYVEDILATVKHLRDDHGDGRLVKMFEDSVLALIVKDYIDYDFVVANPPYVEIQNLGETEKRLLSELYESATGQYDIYCPFYERGLKWLSEDGRLGFIAPNQFMVTDYGESLRGILLNESRLLEIYDFRDSGVFEDATNYPAIVVLEPEPVGGAHSDHQIRCARVKAKTDTEDGRELDEAVITRIRENIDNGVYSDDLVDIFDFPQGELSREYWTMMPPQEWEVFKKLEQEADLRISDIAEAVFHGPTTGANKIFVVDVKDAYRIESADRGDQVTVVPSGGTKEYPIETELLRPWLKGNDIKRWRGQWSGNHVILPYRWDSDDERWTVVSGDVLKEELPLTEDYFRDHEEELRARQSGRWSNSEVWWEFAYPRNLSRFELPKIPLAHISDHPAFMVDEVGTWYFKTAYAVLLKDEYQNLTKVVTCQLNSKVLEFYFKHVATIKAGGYYEYRSQYIEPLPCLVESRQESFDDLSQLATSIIEILDLSSKVQRFPESYLSAFGGEFESIDYEWQTRRNPVEAEIEQRDDRTYAVTAGRTDEITDPRINSKERAEYVHSAVNGRSVKSGETQTIPIPRQDADVGKLLEAWREDRAEVEAADIAALEAEIDEIVYDLFGLDEVEREVVEGYLEVF